mmetsp:Transcript_67036/g.139717  ORF Transcript_67036/g.139717 Transcript_67036/m.139717 type:complete len:100 (+) Transcript_67036:1231-1530(+)
MCTRASASTNGMEVSLRRRLQVAVLGEQCSQPASLCAVQVHSKPEQGCKEGCKGPLWDCGLLRKYPLPCGFASRWLGGAKNLTLGTVQCFVDIVSTPNA